MYTRAFGHLMCRHPISTLMGNGLCRYDHAKLSRSQMSFAISSTCTLVPIIVWTALDV